MKQRIVPICLILGGTAILQYHSIRFWSDYVDPNIGFAWSLVIEATGLWLWYRSGWVSRTLAVLASLLLLAGPVYHMTMPVLQKQAKVVAEKAAYENRVSGLKDQIEQGALLLKTFAQNSTKRTGWLATIERIEQTLSNDRSQLAQLLGNPPDSLKTNGSSVLMLVLLQVFGLVLIQMSNIVAINHLSMLRTDVLKPVQVPLPEARGNDDVSDLLNLKEQVGKFIERESLSLSAAADRLGVDRHNLGHLLRFSEKSDRRPAGAVVMQLTSQMVN